MAPMGYIFSNRWRIRYVLLAATTLALTTAAVKADEAERLLGKVAMPAALRKVIDDNVGDNKGKGPNVAGGGSGEVSDDDMPAAVQVTLDKMHLRKLKLVGAEEHFRETGNSAGSALFDIYSGRLEVRTENHLAADLEARLAHSFDAAIANPVIKPSGFHVLDVVNGLQKPDVPGSKNTIDMSRFNVRVPVDSLARLDEGRQRLADLEHLLPPDARSITQSLGKVIAPDFVVGIMKKSVSTTDDPGEAAIAAAVAAPSLDDGLHALDKLIALPDVQNGRRDFNGISSVVRRMTDGSIRTDTGDPTSGNTEVSSDIPDAGAVTGKVDAALASRDIKNIGADLTQKLVDPAVNAMRQRIDATLNNATAGLSNTINQSLSDVAGKINSALDKAFSAIQTECKNQATTHSSKAADYQKQADAVDVPPVKYEDCQCRRCGDCLWTYKCCCASCPTADSVKANADAQTKKDGLEAQAKAEGDTASKFNQAADQVMQKKNDVETSLNSVFADAAVTIPEISSAGGQVADGGDSTGDKTASTSSQTTHPHGHSLIAHESALQHILKLSGTHLDNVVSTGAVNASVGNNAETVQAIATIGGGDGDKSFTGLSNTSIVTGAVNAAIGSDTQARQVIASVGTMDSDQTIMSLTTDNAVTAAVNAAIGASSQADMRIASVGGSITSGGNLKQVVSAPVNAAVGYNTESTMYIGNIDGNIAGSAKLTLVATAPVAAAIGGNSTAAVRVGNMGEKASINGSLNSTIVQPTGTVAASIGYNSTAEVGLGNIDGTVAGNASMSVTTGPVVSAAIGSSTVAVSRVGEVAPGVRIGGPLSMSALTGLVTTFSVGAGTTARSEVGVIDANVGGGANVNINIGEVITGTVGTNTFAETVVGSVKAPVSGKANISVNAGGINTFAIGLSNSHDIKSQTYIGSVLSAQSGDVNINVNTAGVFTLGFGLVLDIPLLGTLDFSKDGCTKIGNVGSGGC